MIYSREYGLNLLIYYKFIHKNGCYVINNLLIFSLYDVAMRQKIIAFKSDNRGSTIIEYALILPVFLIFIMGILEFALIQFSTSIVENSINEAARYTIVGANDSDSTREASIEKRIKERLYGWDNSFFADLNVQAVAANDYKLLRTGRNISDYNYSYGTGGEFVRFNVLYLWHVRTPLLATVLGADDKGDLAFRFNTIVKNEEF